MNAIVKYWISPSSPAAWIGTMCVWWKGLPQSVLQRGTGAEPVGGVRVADAVVVHRGRGVGGRLQFAEEVGEDLVVAPGGGRVIAHGSLLSPWIACQVSLSRFRA